MLPEMRPSIADIGLKKYLDSTEANHNGCDYAEFMEMLRLGVPMTKIAKRMGVGRMTISKWVTISEQEKQHGN